MSLDTYANLQTSIGTWLDRSDLSPYTSDFITLFESAANRRLRVRQMLTTDTLTPTDGDATLPTDYLEWKRVSWTGDPRRELEYVEPTFLQSAYPSQPGGIPAYFTIEGETLKTMPLADGDFDFTYYQKIPALSVSNTTNWLLTAHPDAYLFGSLVEANAFIESGGPAQLWAARRDAAFDEIERLSRQTQGQMRIRAYGPTP